jgi:ribosome biogenesis GTPase
VNFGSLQRHGITVVISQLLANGMENLERIGFSRWFQNQVDDQKTAVHELARVVSVHRDSYVITKGTSEVYAELSGNLIYTADSASALPTTGDWVYADFFDGDTHAIVHGVLPRKSLLKRKAAGRQIDWQLIAANIDVAFIIQSVGQDFNLRRLERYLIMVNESGIVPRILLSKCDLATGQEIDEKVSRISKIAPQIPVLAFSNLTGENIDRIRKTLLSGQTYCLLGSSGVGKTTLLNSIAGGDYFETRPVSKKTEKGKHTTTSRELVQLQSGAMLIDTPGMRELGSMSVDTGIDETFSEIHALSQSCKFADCSHSNEKGCAVLAAVDDGELSEDRYRNYLKVRKEAAFNDMSYAERRKKDKDFGKMVKATLKGKGGR